MLARPWPARDGGRTSNSTTVVVNPAANSSSTPPGTLISFFEIAGLEALNIRNLGSSGLFRIFDTSFSASVSASSAVRSSCRVILESSARSIRLRPSDTLPTETSRVTARSGRSAG